MTDKKKILLIVSGGIAAYKSLELVRLLVDEGFSILPVMTASSKHFITPLSLSVLSGNKVNSRLNDVDAEMSFGHIELSRQSDIVVVAPATANLLAKASNGIADDLATNILLATDKAVLMAPSMNGRMWTHSATQKNINQLLSYGIKFVGPNEGQLACGEVGSGRMAEPPEIVRAIKKILRPKSELPLSGKRILVTSGPTEESVDPVRYISNRSTGVQGLAIAESLIDAGADVVFVTGPVPSKMPQGAEVVKIKTALEMLDAVTRCGPYDVAICAAAVSDWRTKDVSINKIKKDKLKNTLTLELVKTPDILEYISNSKSRPKLVIGFAAETSELENNALKKLTRKKCDWILANDVSSKNGVMGKSHTTVIRLSDGEKKVFPLMNKSDFAFLLVEDICAEIG